MSAISKGCTAPQPRRGPASRRVVELVTLDEAEIKYSTVQNWYPGDAEGKGGIYNFVTKRGGLPGARISVITWTPGRDRLRPSTWKYPSLASCRGYGIARRVLFHRRLERPPVRSIPATKRPSGQEHHQPDHSKGISAGHSGEYLYAGWSRRIARRRNRAIFTNCDTPADRQQLRRAHGAVYRERRTPPPCSSTRRPPPRSPRTSYSTACSAGSTRRKRWR